MKLSIIVPVYNAEKYIDQTINTLVHQELDDYEILAIIDANCTDRSEKILTVYAAAYPIIKVISEGDTNQAQKMNRGLLMAKGDYVAECDADDFVSLRMYEQLLNRAEGKADAVRCGWFGVWDDSDLFGRGFIQPNYPVKVTEENVIVDMRTADLYEQKMVLAKQCALFAGIFRRQFLLDNEIFWRTDGQNFEDTAVEFKIRSCARDYRFVNEPLYYYRRGNEGSGTATIKDDHAIIEQYDEIERWNDSHGFNFMPVMNMVRFYSYNWAQGRSQDPKGTGKMYAKSIALHSAPKEAFDNIKEFYTYESVREYGVKLWEEERI